MRICATKYLLFSVFRLPVIPCQSVRTAEWCNVCVVFAQCVHSEQCAFAVCTVSSAMTRQWRPPVTGGSAAASGALQIAWRGMTLAVRRVTFVLTKTIPPFLILVIMLLQGHICRLKHCVSLASLFVLKPHTPFSQGCTYSYFCC